jgi:hypothetical protein
MPTKFCRPDIDGGPTGEPHTLSASGGKEQDNPLAVLDAEIAKTSFEIE